VWHALANGAIRFETFTNVRVIAADVAIDGPFAEFRGLDLTRIALAGRLALTGSANLFLVVPVTNDGLLDIGAGSLFTATTLTNLSGGTLTGGTFLLGGVLLVRDANVQTLAANLFLVGPGARIDNQSGANALANLSTVAATGFLSLDSSHTLTI